MFNLSLLSVLLSLAAANNLRILSVHGKLGPEPCAMTCLGTTVDIKTPWRQDPQGSAHGHYILTTTVDISQCEFVSVPIVTTSLHTGKSAQNIPYIGALVSGQSTVVDLKKDSFKISLYGFHGNVFNKLPFLPQYGVFWDVHWSASGFIC